MKLLITTLLSLFSINALAQEEVRCTDGSCLTSGYELFDEYGSFFEIGICNSGDCNLNGWSILRVTGVDTSVVCSDNSCYGKGFQEINPSNNNEMIRNRTCAADTNGVQDCLASGWEDEHFGVNARLEQVRCTDGVSCTNGFIVDTVVDKTAALEEEIADLKEQAKAKKQELKDYLIANKRMNFTLLREIIELKKQVIQLKKELRSGGGIQVVDSKKAVCLTAGGCFTDGYQMIDNN